QSKDAAISAAAVDPVTNGASVTISVNAGTVTYTTCSGAEWTGDATKGWKFKRATCVTGIKTAQIKSAKMKFKGDSLGDTGSFPLTVTTDTDVVVASSTTSYAMRFLLADAKKNDGTQYLNKNTTLASGMCGPPTTTTTIPSCADCCTHVPAFTKIKTVNGVPTATVVGHVLDDSGANLLNLTSGGLYFGGSGVGVPLPSPVPNTLPD